MNIIAVDNEKHALTALSDAINKADNNAEVTGFLSPLDALEYACKNKVDVAFLDISMPGMNGLVLAKKLKDIYGGTNIIFVTSYNSYANNAFEMHVSGYVMKPIEPERVQEELEHLRIPPKSGGTGVFVQCFGNFEVFFNGKPVQFKRAKSKEVFAYLIDRKGAQATKKEVAAILWGDEPYNRSKQIQLQTIIAEMFRALSNAEMPNVIIKQRGRYSVDISKINCDYYAYLTGITSAVNQYRGEYMVNYSWAEFTAGSLE